MVSGIHRVQISSPYLSTPGGIFQVLDHVNKMLNEGLPLLGVGGSEVLEDWSHALNAGGEGGLLELDYIVEQLGRLSAFCKVSV